MKKKKLKIRKAPTPPPTKAFKDKSRYDRKKEKEETWPENWWGLPEHGGSDY